MAKILVVDDELEIRDALSTLLSDALGHEVETAETQRKAMDIVQHWLPDLLIVDWMLGNDEDGCQVAASIRTMVPFLPVIMITGYSLYDLQTKLGSVPLTWLLDKPCPHEELLDAIELALRSHNHDS